MLRFLALIGLLGALHPLAAVERDARWPDFGVEAGVSGATIQSGSSEYFQGFEAPCFGPPYSPAAGDDWIRFFSEVVRVPSGSGGIASRSGLNHAELRPPCPVRRRRPLARSPAWAATQARSTAVSWSKSMCTWTSLIRRS